MFLIGNHPFHLAVELTRFPILEKLYLNNNKLLPPELGERKTLKTLPVELTLLLILENLYLDNNKLSVLPPELGELKTLKVLVVDYNMLVSVPVGLRQTVWLVEMDFEEPLVVKQAPEKAELDDAIHEEFGRKLLN
ncbi:Leucine rich repeat 4 [Corchorus olitorius]|uniref:Leucine rich repeat 4 n=1 Tax=Corchorus olitorius TaxID=93759 RepID=A0A1R3IT00_9ROSI|nr:Leucine rich repeat 4 [Corchorus olitorius]